MSWGPVLSRPWAGPWRYARAGPVTTGYLLVLLAGHVWLDRSPDADRALAWLSTDLDNLHRHPVGSLVGSLFVLTGPLDPTAPGFGGTLITLVLGIGVALWWFESRTGSLPAAGVLVVGHVGATLLTAPVIVAAVASGRYPPDVRSALDVGISYGAQAALAAATVLLPRWAVPFAVVFVLGWPLTDADWYGALPDFTTVGHLISVGLGFVVGALVLMAGRSGPRSPSGR